MEQTIKFFTLGCKVNQYETQLIREDFLRRGFRELNNGAVAGCYVVNTCTVTRRADAESLNLIRRARQENPRAKIIATGCLAELEAEKIRQVSPAALIFRNKDKNIIANFFCRINGTNGINEPNGLNERGISFFQGHTRAFLKVQDGCDNFCSYCRVPLARGRSRSRAMSKILTEAKRLAKAGYKEVVLTGICLGSYGRDLKPKADIAELVEKIGQVAGIARIRLSSIELLDVSPRLIKLMRGRGKLCPHLHIPLQSGDNGVLKAMRRAYTAADFLRQVKEMKAAVPRLAITTDVMVGFPGEDEVAFNNTLALVKKIAPLKAHIFPYSPRPGTRAGQIAAGRAPGQVVKKRCCRLRTITEEASRKFRGKFIGRALAVLVEGGCRERPGFMQGYSDNYIKVIMKAQGNLLNRIVKVRINKAEKDFCAGIICNTRY